ncbi:hypothetical protein [Spiroplasma monobiae]|uniref:Uncharacterized protein n=1 Tax=Spiroplasma monobiae MQ-1 TaxID=1336748 RepID=A0A2K9LUD4_SPISQ|nr:hypothetical protein [Spiroplasma monobiae]AUM62521.1 hypothetical protein SMONO_v1c02720 [Spiroplasma monobiae MQ-1]
MQEAFKAIDWLFKDIVPKDIKYVFKEKYETDQSYEFILVIEEKDLLFFKNKKSENLIKSIIDIANSSNSNFSKKIVIDLEVLETYA